MPPLTVVVAMPTLPGTPFTDATVLVSPGSGSVSLASTPGALAVTGASSVVVLASSTAVGGSLTVVMVIVTVAMADDSPPATAWYVNESVIVSLPLCV